MRRTLKDYGEKVLISDFIKPLINADNDFCLAGDDCGLFKVGDKFVCVSTDRVPADLNAFKWGIMNYFHLGYYLAVLNISDVCAMGAKPVGLVLNLAFPSDFYIEDFQTLFSGIKSACDQYNCTILGGDLSDSSEISLTATSIGICDLDKAIYRQGALSGDYIFCSDAIGVTSAAQRYHKLDDAKKTLAIEDLEKLHHNFLYPTAKNKTSEILSKYRNRYRFTCMDNTDGLGQCFLEMSQLNGLKYVIDYEKLEIPEIVKKVSDLAGADPVDVAFSYGADLQLTGTIDRTVPQDVLSELIDCGIHIIGSVSDGKGIYIERNKKEEPLHFSGWNYYI